MAFSLYDDDSPYFIYENMDDWHNGDTYNFYNGGTHNSKTGVTSRVRFTMSGTIFRLYCQTYIGGRNINIKVIVNGSHVDTINAPQTLQNGHVLFYTSPTFSYGDHDIILEHNGTQDGFIMFDGVDTDGFLHAILGSIVPPVVEQGWKRIDNTDSNFALVGSWNKTVEDAQWGGYNNTWTWSTVADDEIVFMLQSTKLRIYTYGWADTSGYDLYIDNVLIKRINTNFGVTTSLLSYENLNLSSDIHTIRMVLKDKLLFPGSTTTRIMLDCIDINTNGYLIPIYSSLPSPETNWTRYDGSDPNVILSNIKTVYTGDVTNHMNGTAHVTDNPTIPSSISIKISGSKVRLIAPIGQRTNKNVIVKVDGKIIDTFTTLNVDITGKRLYYETPELIHSYDKYITVEFIYPDENSNPFFDCFDVYDGMLVQNPISIINTNSNVIYECTNLISNTININKSGIYSIECWGANGGGNKNRSEGSSGGWGGYSYGEIHFNENDIIYCTPGGQGILATANFNGGGFNGGGNGGATGHGGGGGTDVRYKIDDINHRIIVAGGGGGADNVGTASTGSDDGSGGHGGGLVGQGAFISGICYQQYGATQTSGYTAWAGQSATTATDTGGGGGGYYGGLVTNNNNGGAGGGSGYIGNLNNAYTSSGVWWGNGKVKITLLQEDTLINFQHYVIKTCGKYIIPNASNFDIIKKEFKNISLKDAFDCGRDLSMYITNINDMFKPFIINEKKYYPFDYIKGIKQLQICKFVGHRNSPQILYNKKYNKITFKTDFTKFYKSTLIKAKDSVYLAADIMNNFININSNTPCKVAIEYNSTLFGRDFTIIKEDEIVNKGFSFNELAITEIPFDNIRLVFMFLSNVAPTEDELSSINIIKKSKNLEKIIYHKDYELFLDNNASNIHIKIINNSISNMTVNRITKDASYRVKDTLNTF